MMTARKEEVSKSEKTERDQDGGQTRYVTGYIGYISQIRWDAGKRETGQGQQDMGSKMNRAAR